VADLIGNVGLENSPQSGLETPSGIPLGDAPHNAANSLPQRVPADTGLTSQVKTNTGLFDGLHLQMANTAKKVGTDVGDSPPGQASRERAVTCDSTVHLVLFLRRLLSKKEWADPAHPNDVR
jgi:hypothetical protein